MNPRTAATRRAGPLHLLLVLAAAPILAQEPAVSLPPAAHDRLPRWRGFNLLEKFHLEWSNGPFVEEDFRLIRELGFNFVRLPMDYRTWIVEGDWTRLNEAVLTEIDAAVAWGEQYGIHVMLNFHRAPGYTVASPAEPRSLWTDAEAQRVCALHWAAFARRYRGVPNHRLSFNLFNEPAGLDEAAYAAVVERVVAAIRAEDPERLIVSDGLDYGARPALSLAPLRLAQATRGYAPGPLTHYLATWVAGADRYPLPSWPYRHASGTLYAPTKPDLDAAALEPIRVGGPLGGAVLRLRVGEVSSRAELAVRAGGQTLWSRAFVPAEGPGEWAESRFEERWRIWVGRWDKDYEITLPDGCTALEIAVTAGDWLRLTELGLRRDGAEEALRLSPDWNRRPAQVTWTPGAAEPLTVDGALDRQWLWDTMIVPWQRAEAAGIGVMVGEFGAWNTVPHAVTLRWMEDCLRNWRAAGWGWALWNFRGSFGILDSARQDVTYEPFAGHRLDRAMLELLQRY